MAWPLALSALLAVSAPVSPDAGSALGATAESVGAAFDEEAEGLSGEGEGDTELEADGFAPTTADGGHLYTADLSEAELEERWAQEPRSLGSISVGFADMGRLINGVQLEEGEAWTVVAPSAAYGTRELIDAIEVIARRVHDQFGDTVLRVNHIAKKEGGYLRPHHSHQSGRDVDLGFFYRGGTWHASVRGPREQAMDLARNWALVRAMVTLADVQVILVDRRVQRVLYDFARAIGEDKDWLDRLFKSGRDSLVQHARGHRDHFHLRIYAGRSQELGRRVQPLLARRAEQNLVIHRIRRGDTLGHIARAYGSTVKLIQKANAMNRGVLAVGRTVNVPLRGPCNRCPLPPPVRVPPRCLPPPPPARAES